jgi:hypothetical protein
MKKDPQVELFKALNEMLTEALGCPVYTDIAANASYPSWVVISQYNSAPLGSKTHYATNTSWLIEVFTAERDVISNNEIVNTICSTINPYKGREIELDNFYVNVLLEPTGTAFTENNERGMVHRSQLRYSAQIDQK